MAQGRKHRSRDATGTSAAGPHAGSPSPAPAEHQPFVPDEANLPEFTWSAVLLGAVLGIIFGASSLYLTLKLGMTVSASIPVAVLSITLFRAFSRAFGVRQATILENNIVQTTGSAGESIAFGVGVTMPALLLLGFDMEITRVMTVGVLGGLLGILMMIPLRRAFIVRQHGTLIYPEGTACADVLIVGEQGGSTAKTVFVGFSIAIVHKLATLVLKLWPEIPTERLYTADGQGLRGGEFGGDLSPELLGVGFIIGPKVASIMLAGGVLANLVLLPLIVFVGSSLTEPLLPGKKLISEMSTVELHKAYILYIGAGAVATGGLISMLQALPLIVNSIRAGLADLTAAGKRAAGAVLAVPRTQLDLPLKTLLIGSGLLIVALAASPNLGLGFNVRGMAGAVLIVLLGFLFVTVSARITGEIGSSSNPISGMTVATLLITCLVYVLLQHTDKAATLCALSVAAVVCVAASNGGTTAQDLKTGYLVGSTPRDQQVAILIGALTSALVMGGTLILLNQAGTVYSNRAEYLPNNRVPNVAELTQLERAGGTHADDSREYHVWHATEGEVPGVPQGKYLVDDDGKICYLVDPGINGRIDERDDKSKVSEKFQAPKARLMAVIIDGIMNRRLPWGLVLIGSLIAITLELSGVPSLPFAVGVYLPIHVSVPIFIGGAARWLIDKLERRSAAESESSPGVLLSSGYIAGGSIAGILVAMLQFAPAELTSMLNFGSRLRPAFQDSRLLAVAAFSVLLIVLLLVSSGKMLRGERSDALR